MTDLNTYFKINFSPKNSTALYCCTVIHLPTYHQTEPNLKLMQTKCTNCCLTCSSIYFNSLWPKVNVHDTKLECAFIMTYFGSLPVELHNQSSCAVAELKFIIKYVIKSSIFLHFNNERLLGRLLAILKNCYYPRYEGLFHLTNFIAMIGCPQFLLSLHQCTWQSPVRSPLKPALLSVTSSREFFFSYFLQTLKFIHYTYTDYLVKPLHLECMHPDWSILQIYFHSFLGVNLQQVSKWL